MYREKGNFSFSLLFSKAGSGGQTVSNSLLLSFLKSEIKKVVQLSFFQTAFAFWYLLLLTLTERRARCFLYKLCRFCLRVSFENVIFFVFTQIRFFITNVLNKNCGNIALYTRLKLPFAR
ncbi:hypothetical protein GGTG_08977 [Gaeumannomyces tritici R3-111a-1]|uniref:Transmembrane protein n=1 Tax=Gaeumannomyces tritici (strain R3-111a-1) TaxID=644352 RepID=J3P636_GAET3|nr:hypothetical protein GGTG_08977 [Gaeumannomyces tritici R3-111a-1]EJT72109.1 hypothetical protein GGTG_08977 [Gaeumannomyces tritici R3-111a-1]